MISFVRNASRLLGVCSVLLALNVASAQTQLPRLDTSKSTFGAFVDGSLNLYNASFQTLPGVPNCCTLFQTGNGFGYEAGLFYDYDAFGPGQIGVRAGIGSLNGTLKADESVELSINGVGQQGIVEYTIASKFTVASIVPYYAYDFGGLRLMAGPDIGLILTPTYNKAQC